MILVFGGTTEGRQAVATLEEAGSPYYYSTRGEGQQIDLVHGHHLTGDMDVAAMVTFCREQGIRLLVDAAHPFAEVLHRNLLLVVHQTGVPLIRYDRIYPSRDSLSGDLIWCQDYEEVIRQLEHHHIERLLALTGVNTIGRLKPYWSHHPSCMFRILNRGVSKTLAVRQQFPAERLVFYNDELRVEHEEQAVLTLLRTHHADAILTKESGLSGGFMEKIAAARQAGVKIFVVSRPVYPPHIPDQSQHSIVYVNGPHGLRRAVEQLVPEFYPLHSGLTTGTCATAAAIAATRQFLQCPALPQVPVLLPDGETIPVTVNYGDGYAVCVKEAGDDPDVTNGIEVRATVTSGHTSGIEILGGEGVGTFTLPGFDAPPGKPAINKGPQEMIRKNLSPFGLSLQVTISVPQGADIARRTFNPRLGIEGGISIIGVSGIVKPFSEEAFLDSIRKCMQVAKASGTDHVVINSGAKSERFLRARYPELPMQAFVQYGNYIGKTIQMAHEMQLSRVTLGVMLGKAVKLAQGHLDTHSRKATMDMDFIRQLLREAGITIDLRQMTLARELWQRIPADQLADFVQVIIRHCADYCNPLLPEGQLTILLIDEDGRIW